jgi:hypothetical protein
MGIPFLEFDRSFLAKQDWLAASKVDRDGAEEVFPLQLSEHLRYILYRNEISHAALRAGHLALATGNSRTSRDGDRRAGRGCRRGRELLID